MSAARRRVLVVSYRFPPHGGGGVQRTAYFVRYLPALGWDPHVLTGPLEGRRLLDEELLGLVPDSVPVTRTNVLPVESALRWCRKLHLAGVVQKLTPSLPNMDGRWILPAYWAGRKLLQKYSFDVIYSSAYPIASHCVAGRLHGAAGIPWVADYRDEWSTREVLRWPTPAHRALGRRIDRWVIGSATRVVTTSPAHTDRLARVFAGGDAGRFATITNGFDEDDFKGPEPVLEKSLEGKFVLTHVGSVFEWRPADAVLKAVQELRDARHVANLVVCFVGRTGNVGFSELQRQQVVRDIGYVSHSDAVRWMRSSSALLLINTESTNIPGKTFEYLAAGKPILAVVREGPTADLIRRTGAGTVVQPDDRAAIRQALSTLYGRWEAGRVQDRDPARAGPYSRTRLTERLARVLDESAIRSAKLAASSESITTHRWGNP